MNVNIKKMTKTMAITDEDTEIPHKATQGFIKHLTSKQRKRVDIIKHKKKNGQERMISPDFLVTKGILYRNIGFVVSLDAHSNKHCGP